MATAHATDPFPPHSELEVKQTTTFAEVAKPMWDNPAFKDVLFAFREFLTKQELASISKNQLELFRGLSALVLEASAKSINNGDISDILATSTRSVLHGFVCLQTKKELNDMIKDPNELNKMESSIREGFQELEVQLCKILEATELEATLYREGLAEARQRDRAKIEELQAIMKLKTSPQPSSNFDTVVEELMEEKLKAQQIEAKQALAILVELTGKPLPPSTMLGKEFVTIGHAAIYQGTSYDVFRGEYFTGEKIAVKRLRHRVDEVTAKKGHERFGQQALGWSSLRHDAILPSYGIGVTPSQIAEGEWIAARKG
ncbi:hypothetical protein FRC07_012697 [Ceratobasidium sp. 392]|nr:hypothetical protein FRC07_012697 [Ceratobasidium sp. 392]